MGEITNFWRENGESEVCVINNIKNQLNKFESDQY